MAKTIANVLTGVATLSIRQPNDALAEWSTVQQQAGSWAVKLYKGNSGNAGSTHLQISDLESRAITMTAWTAAITTNSYYHHCSAVTGNFIQMEFRFEDPDSDAWVEITDVVLQTYLGTNAWVQTTLADADNSGYGGVDEAGLSISNWTLAVLNGQQGIIEGVTTGADCSNWLLSRVRLELWEATPERTAYVDTVEIMGTTYPIEPGGTAPAMSLSSPFTEVGYTEDGVSIEYAPEISPIYVMEETVAIDASLVKEVVKVTCNMAESSLYNIDKAMAGSVLSGNIIRVGDGTLKTMNLKVEGVTPAGKIRAFLFPKAISTGTVAMAYKKGEKTIVPIEFFVLKASGSDAFQIVDNAA